VSGPLLALSRIHFGYPEREVLGGIDLALYPGERIALIGPNGSGKTSVLHLLMGLLRPSKGVVRAFGVERRKESDFREIRRRVGLLFQDSEDQLFCPTVLEDVAFGPLNLGRSPEQARSIAESALTDLGLPGLGERVTHRLSGGEKRLVALAAVLAMGPEVLLLDEPTNGLDEEAERRLVEHLAGLRQAMIFVSHDRRLVGRLATRAVLLREGRLREARVHSHPHTHTHNHVHVHPADPDADPRHAGACPVHEDHHGGEQGRTGVPS
jgi:cobalt/nickel transport system ATP-binding protein